MIHRQDGLRDRVVGIRSDGTRDPRYRPVSIVRRHDGPHASSRGGSSKPSGSQGSEFVVRLPGVIEKPELQPAEPTESAPGNVQAHRILVVDDNVDAASSLAMLLKLTGNETHTAHAWMRSKPRRPSIPM